MNWLVAESLWMSSAVVMETPWPSLAGMPEQ
jgi:hypothetical protein